jgi:hypothetical protein
MYDCNFDDDETTLALSESTTDSSPNITNQKDKQVNDQEENDDDEDEVDEDEDEDEDEDDEEIEAEIANDIGTSIKRKSVAWQFEKNFKNEEEAHAEVMGNWTHVKEHITAGGLKVFHKCTWPKCPTKMYLYHVAVDKIIMMNNQGIL